MRLARRWHRQGCDVPTQNDTVLARRRRCRATCAGRWYGWPDPVMDTGLAHPIITTLPSLPRLSGPGLGDSREMSGCRARHGTRDLCGAWECDGAAGEDERRDDEERIVAGAINEDAE